MNKIAQTGDKPFCCTVCEKEFALLRYLKDHEKIHSGEKPFSCEYCDKVFRQKGNVVRHKRIHTGEKPYNCKHVTRSFPQTRPLKTMKRFILERGHLFAMYVGKLLLENKG